MNRFAVLDISTLIWDINDYNQNRSVYYKLMEVLPALFTEILNNHIPILFRLELVGQVHVHFPYTHIPGEYYDYQVSTLNFLSHVAFQEYPPTNNKSIVCTPNMVKSHYSAGTQSEVRYVVTYLYTERNAERGVLTFKHLWPARLLLELQHRYKVSIKVELCDSVKKHQEILLRFKKVFEHNPKHNQYKSSPHAHEGEVISKLSCYNERKRDTGPAQALLDQSVLFRNGYYAFDADHGTYVKFVLTSGNKYHGYNVKLSEDDLTNLRKVFNK